MAQVTSRRKKKITNVPKGRIYVQSTFNNTIITLTDSNGGVLGWETAGHSGFRGARKSTPYAAQVAMKSVIDKAQTFQVEEVDVYVKGVGSGRESAVRALQGSGITVTGIKDITPIAHNGCRPKKPRRV
ncbi:MAG TPA: 30S ribosomal protein S11 [Patescibacteria group bacterium]